LQRGRPFSCESVRVPAPTWRPSLTGCETGAIRYEPWRRCVRRSSTTSFSRIM
jgi:hypothetical protein